MLKVAKCVRVNFFVGALINMVCELKLLQGLKKLRKNFMVIRHCVKELLGIHSTKIINQCSLHSQITKFSNKNLFFSFANVIYVSVYFIIYIEI